MLTLPMVAATLPPSLKKSVTQGLVDQLNNLAEDSQIAEAVRENFISYSSVLQDGRFKVEDYLHAVKFVSFKLMSLPDRDAYIRTFPERYQELVSRGTTSKELSSYVSMYKRGKLVTMLLEQSMVPFHVINQDARQRALNKQLQLMANAKSEMVQFSAANSILQHTAPPPAVVGTQLNLNIGESSGLKDLEATLRQLAAQQKQLIESGVSTRSIAAQAIVDAEVEPAK